MHRTGSMSRRGALATNVSPAGRRRSGQRLETFLEAGQWRGHADSLLGGFEYDEGDRLAAFHLAEQFVVDEDFGDAAVRKTAHEIHPAHVILVDAQTHPRRKQDLQRRNHPEETSLAIRGLEG